MLSAPLVILFAIATVLGVAAMRLLTRWLPGGATLIGGAPRASWVLGSTYQFFVFPPSCGRAFLAHAAAGNLGFGPAAAVAWLESSGGSGAAVGATGGPWGLSWEDVFLVVFASYMMKDIIGGAANEINVLAHHVVCLIACGVVQNPDWIPRGKALFCAACFVLEVGSLVNSQANLRPRSKIDQYICLYGMWASNGLALALAYFFLTRDAFAAVHAGLRWGFMMTGILLTAARQLVICGQHKEHMALITAPAKLESRRPSSRMLLRSLSGLKRGSSTSFEFERALSRRGSLSSASIDEIMKER